eukprot:COSAG04_NODE_779_length_10341_cov_3.429799_5_plen_588_part_00
MAADAALLHRSYLSVSESTDRLMASAGLAQPQPEQQPEPEQLPEPRPSTAGRRRSRRAGLGPNRRESLTGRIRDWSVERGLDEGSLSMVEDKETSGSRLRAAREARESLKRFGFHNAAEAFAFGDTDRDGLLAAPDVDEWLEELGVSEASRHSVILQLSRGRPRDGCVDARQWMRVFNHASFGRLPTQQDQQRAVRESAAPKGRRDVRERLDTYNALRERREELEAVRDHARERDAAAGSDEDEAAGSPTPSSPSAPASPAPGEDALDGGAVLWLARRECELRGVADAAEAFWFFADSIEGGQQSSAGRDLLAQPPPLRHRHENPPKGGRLGPLPPPPPYLNKKHLLRGLATLGIQSVAAGDLLRALAASGAEGGGGGRARVSPTEFLQHFSPAQPGATTEKKMHPFAVTSALARAGRPTERARVRALAYRRQQEVARGELRLPSLDELQMEAVAAAEASDRLRAEVEAAAVVQAAAARAVVEEAFAVAQAGSDDESAEEEEEEDSEEEQDKSPASDWRATTPPPFIVAPVDREWLDLSIGDPIFAPFDAVAHAEVQPTPPASSSLPKQHRSARLLGAVFAPAVRGY